MPLINRHECSSPERGRGVSNKKMKKILSVLILTLTVALGCSSSKKAADETVATKADKSLEFEYTAITRGNYKKVIVNSSKVMLATAPSARPVVTDIDAKDWNAIVAFYEKNIVKKGVNLEALEAPSKKHQYDGALSATLTIKSADASVSTPTFDHGNPPAEIKVLVDEIVKLAGFETKE